MANRAPSFRRPDLRKEVRVIAGHHSALRRRAPTTLDYVQDGLYYQLDGIENAGRGVHDASATSWTDLTGNNRNASFINGKTWLDDAVYLYGKTSDNMAKIRGLPSMTAFTFELVFRVDSYENYARLFDSEAYGTARRRFCGLVNTASFPTAPSFSIASDSDRNFSSFNFLSMSDPAGLSVFPSGSISGTNAVSNGVRQSVAYSATPSSAAAYIDIANRSNNPNRGADMAVFAIRCYNRVLSAAEIAANYAIDKERFNLP